MNTHLITAAIGEPYQTQLMQITGPRWADYARHWGYGFEAYTAWPDFSGKHGRIQWMQIIMLLNKLHSVPDGDVVVWIDGDIVPVRGDIPLALPDDKNIGLAFDQPYAQSWQPDPLKGPNAGLIVARSSPFAKWFYQLVWDRADCEDSPWTSNMSQNLTICSIIPPDIHKNFHELPRCLNVTLSNMSMVPREEIRFKHFAGGEHWDPSFWANPVAY